MLGTACRRGALINGLQRRPPFHRQPDSRGRRVGSIDLVKEGKALGASLSECRTLFPGSVLEMVAVAEESGKLDTE